MGGGLMEGWLAEFLLHALITTVSKGYQVKLYLKNSN
jgi:hypothetical protein